MSEIKVGEYVNGYKIDYDFEIITNEKTGNKSIVYRNDIDRVNQIYDWSIKSIVTKEMFNQLKYEV